MKIPQVDVTDVVKKIWRKCQLLFIGASAVVLLCWVFPPVRAKLFSIGFFEQNTMFYIVALAVTLLVTILGEVKTGMNELTKKLDKFNKDSSSQIITNGVLNVYPFLNPVLDAVENKREKTLDVIGLTLYSAWPHIQAWMTLEKTRDWIIHFYGLDAAYIQENHAVMPSKWVKEAESAKDQIDYFIKEKKELLERKAVSLDITTYCNLPPLHGFKVGDGSLYISFTHWSDKNLIDDPHSFYEYFHCEDKTGRAKSYRNLFENWVNHYKNPASASHSPAGG